MTRFYEIFVIHVGLIQYTTSRVLCGLQGGINLGPNMIQVSDLCGIIPKNMQIIFYRARSAEITVW